MEEIRKRNTDCVYFLASPFTCKKGSRCEYRHSESARLNPKDCWYWLRGNCLNPNCGFRHPPFEVSSRPLSEQSYGALSSGKANIPCYFYRHVHCIKGDQCLFLHDFLPAPKLSGVAPEATTGLSMGKIAFACKDKVPPSGELPAIIRPKDTSELIEENQCKEVSPQPEPCPLLEEKALSVDSIPESKEHAIPLPESCSHFWSDQSSEELAEDCSDTEDVTNLDASPGFDVLVDDGSEQLADEDDAENQLAQKGESKIPYRHNFSDDFQELAGYDKSDFPDHEFLYDSYDRLGLYERELEFCREKISERMLCRKRKPLYTAYENDARDGGDLQGNLRKRSRPDSEILHSFWPGYDSRAQLVRHEMGWHHRRRLILESPKIATISPLYPKQPRKKRRKKAHRRRGTNHSSRSDKDIKLTSPLVKSAVVTADFSGPKTLAQIKEENGRGNSKGSGSAINIHQYSRSHLSNDFDWPKPLNELLKGKKRPQSIDGNNGSDVLSDIGNEQIANGNVEKDYGKYEYSFLSKTHNGDDAEYEEVDLQKKLAEIFSQ
ncbi:zinc finger CCCH domain-containing protein 34-like [Ananas comosus]|uniref:Zinc finger CCCH domain-containing protein 34-like n=1 Tax=Ananas comosus TaxID=4615 RepID=A0A6P5FQA4_ANACO|nr:zinc finger CCCH domain-containing protein 34-like [Ananas comosus]XP_020080947.1 zinc finger CCCH domain-containing protein 34-like [Ananas comosus]XP_020080948.1 zinc finger CCCH domain-containing protein 34-like [Ananas comosus]XP_020097857.1 zinc finger CCCH domain-containing protein 34-like [Ananas comosus]XP_020097858.1 zinc finger CCCH domain-containing protein 34-like [Ananas comosus]XP_020097859.1 zinc finger CCCH domain-containing protein 34-like [Ananas comosus]